MISASSIELVRIRPKANFFFGGVVFLTKVKPDPAAFVLRFCRSSSDFLNASRMYDMVRDGAAVNERRSLGDFYGVDHNPGFRFLIASFRDLHRSDENAARGGRLIHLDINFLTGARF